MISTRADVAPWPSVFSGVAAHRRRLVLGSLHATARTDLASLAETVAERERADRSGSSDAAVEDVHVALHHVHVPTLDDAGLIEWDGDAVVLPDHPVVARTAEVMALVGADPSLDDPFAALANARRLRVVSTLRGADGSLSVAAIVDGVRERMPGADRPAAREIETALVHVDLPVLVDAGVVVRASEGRLAFDGLPIACELLVGIADDEPGGTGGVIDDADGPDTGDDGGSISHYR